MLESNSKDGLERYEKVTSFQIESGRVGILLESLPATILSDSPKQTVMAAIVCFMSRKPSPSRNHHTNFICWQFVFVFFMSSC